MAKRYTDEDLLDLDDRFRELVFDQGWSYLLTDPSVASRKAVRNALQKEGCENIFEAKNEAEALEALKKTSGRLVALVELNLGKTSGVQLLKKIRQMPAHEKAILFLTAAKAGKTDLVQAAQHRIAGFLKKPFQPDAVIAKLREVEAL